jgi:hypothetical protein
MVDFLTPVLIFVLEEAAKRGFDAFSQHRRGAQPVPVDLTRDEGYRTRVRIRPVAQVQAQPYWVLLGLRDLSGRPWSIPLLYGEQQELIVARNKYEVAALFFSKPTSIEDKPLLLATGKIVDMLVSSGLQMLDIPGHQLRDEEILELRQAMPAADRAYRLPETSSERYARLLGDWQPSGLGTGTSLPRSIGQTSWTTDPLGLPPRRFDRPIRVRGRVPFTHRWVPPPNPAWQPSMPLTRSLTPPPDRPALPPAPKPAEPPAAPPTAPTTAKSYDSVCEARTRKGQRCRNPARSSQGDVCPMHLDMIVAGKKVFWFASGEPISLRRPAR